MNAEAGNGYNGAFAIHIIKRHMQGDASSPAAAQNPEPNQAEAEQAHATELAAAETLKAEMQAEAIKQAHTDLARQLPELQILVMEEIGRMRGTLAQIVRSTCEKIIGERYIADEILERCLEASIREHAGKATIFLHVAPSDWTTAERTAHKVSQAIRALEIRIVQDPALPSGECKMETGGITVEVGLKPQLELLENLLARADTAKNVFSADLKTPA